MSNDVESFDARMDGDPDGTITVSGGQGPNFDDFETVERSREQYADAREEKTTEDKPETEEKSVGEKVEETDERVEADKNLDHSPEKDEEKVEIKFLKSKLGDKELELDPDTEIPVTIDGKTEYRKLSDLRNHEAGQVHWDKKFSELDTQMKERESVIKGQEAEVTQFKQERDALFQDIGKMHEMIQANKPYDAMEFLVAQSGGNKYAFKRALMEQLAPEFQRLSEMTPEEQRAEFAQNEADFLREQMRSLEEERAAETSRRESQQQLAQLRESRGISQEAYDESLADLRAAGRSDLDPRLVVEHAYMKPLVAKAEGLIEKIHPASVENDDLVIEMARIFAEDPTLTDEEANSLLRDALGLEEKEKKVLEKAQRTGQVRRAPENPGNYKYYGSSDPGDDDHIEGFSDYDDLY